MSAAEVSFRPLPSMEKIFDPDIVYNLRTECKIRMLEL
jgi:hypothetical protein